jgi:putative DNA primase/helicase
MDMTIQTAEAVFESAKVPHSSVSGYELTAQGLFQVPKDDGLPQLLCDPIWIDGDTEDFSSSVHGFELSFLDKYGRKHTRTMENRVLYDGRTTLFGDLANAGLEIVPGADRKILHYLAMSKRSIKQTRISSNRTGWLDRAGSLSFVTPTGTVTTGKDIVVYQPERHSHSKNMRSAGSLQDWQKHVASIAEPNDYFVFAICFAFVGSLLKFANMDSFGVHLHHKSSGGKTTSGQLAASVWGCGADPACQPNDSFLKKWHSTGNGLESLASAHNDCLMVLDEIGTFIGGNFDAVVYNLTGGLGKSTMDRDRNLKEQKAWRIACFSTGELSIKEKIEEGGKTVKGGQMVRFLDLRIDSLVEDCEEAKFRAMDIKESCGKYFGTAGSAFLKEIVKYSADDISEMVTNLMNDLEPKLTSETLEPAASRVLRRFALIAAAGTLATRMKILPFSEGRVFEAVKSLCSIWLAETNGELSDDDRAIESVRQYMLKNQARFQQYEAAYPPQNRAGYIRHGVYYFFKDSFKEACAGQSPKTVAKRLKEKGFLKCSQNDNNQANLTPPGGNSGRYYAILPSIFGSSHSEDSFNE